MSFVGVWRRVKPYLAMVFLQFGYAGMYVISVATLKQGMSHYVLSVYRNVIAAAVIAPFALWFESRKARPRMTLRNFFKIMALALLEPVLDQNLYYMGAKKTNASFASALYNILPAMTFVNAILLRMEKVDIKKRRGQAKIIGTLVTLVGALLMILYKGRAVEFFWTKGRNHHNDNSGSQDGSHWLEGVFMLLSSCFCWSAFVLLQSNTLKSYPAELSLTCWMCFMGAVQCGAVALVMERHTKPWLIGFDLRLLTVVYTAIMCSGITYYIQGIVIKERGPVFVTAFNPLCMIIVAILGSIILAEEITSGRVIGATIIVIGLYFLIWGKSKDHLTQSSNDDDDENKAGPLELPISATDAIKSNSADRATVAEIPSAKSPRRT